MGRYIVLDLEMCKVGKNYRRNVYRYPTEIIQIGAIMLNDSWDQIGDFNMFVKPEYGRIDNFIKNLTGIQERLVKNAPSLKEALLAFAEWIGEEEEFKLIAWSNSDWHQMNYEVGVKNLDDEKIRSFMDPELWVDYQKIFNERYDLGRSVKLSEALDLVDVETEGHVHNGLDDAFNTAKLISKLEKDPNFELPIHQMGVRNEESQDFGVSLGELFSADFLNSFQ